MSEIEGLLELREQIDTIDEIIKQKTRDLMKRRGELEVKAGELEASILNSYYTKEYGQQTIIDSGYKILMKRDGRYSLDSKVWDTIKDDLPPDSWPVTYKPTLSTTKFNQLKKNGGDIYQKVCNAVTLKINDKAKIEIERV